MPADFSTLRNYHEHEVFKAVTQMAPQYPLLTAEQWPDVACVALNRMPPRYIRHQADMSFHLSEKERLDNERNINESVQFAFEFIQARVVMRARI